MTEQFKSKDTKAVWKNKKGKIFKSNKIDTKAILDKNKENVKGVSFAPKDMPIELHVICN